jgi:hypothetical protein
MEFEIGIGFVKSEVSVTPWASSPVGCVFRRLQVLREALEQNSAALIGLQLSDGAGSAAASRLFQVSAASSFPAFGA